MHEVIKEILLKLHQCGFQGYIVGGYVRDFFLLQKNFDLDFCTDAKPSDLERIFSFKTNFYGALHFNINPFAITITPFRKEKKYISGKLESFSFIEDLLVDLERRDFTMNAICMDINEKIIDPYNGIEDIKNKCIRMILDPVKKIKEDPIRILRAIRFSSVYDFTIESTLENAIRNNICLLKDVSLYRIKDELSKIFSSKKAQKGMDLLQEYEVLSILNLSYTQFVYTEDIYGMWAQLKESLSMPFTKKEKEHIVKIRDILRLGTITNSTLYIYGVHCAKVAGKILKLPEDKIIEMDRNLPIHSREELNITRKEIYTCIKLKNQVSLVEKKLIVAVLNNQIKNKNQDLKEYIVFLQERWKN